MSAVTPFLGAPPPGTIDFGVGQPSANLLPVDLIREASDAFLDEAQPFDLNYGVMQGDERFLTSLAGYLTEEYGVPASSDSLCVTGGNSQALDLVSTVFASAGDTVFVEEPSYYLAFQIFRDHGLTVVGIPVDDGGMRIDALEAQLAQHRPAFVYVIPAYHNPCGHCMSAARRARLSELSIQHGFLIIADEVYHLLHYGDAPPPAFGTIIEGDNVVSLGTFSKILAPTLRLGWIQTGPALLRRVLENGYIGSGGSINHYSSHVARYAIDLGLLRTNVTRLREAYRTRIEAMHSALTSEFDDRATWSRPDGGYFFWLRFDDDLDAESLLDRARELEVGFQPGSVFSSDGRLGNFVRLSFAHYGEDEIREGVGRLRRLFD